MTQNTSYNRANDRWICGNAGNGCPCVKGPDNKGNCGAQTQCTPVKRQDRWHCTRSINHGGSCQTGPSPDGHCCHIEPGCSPIPGYKQKKWIYLQVTALLVLIFLLLGLSPMHFEDFADPGPLAQPHAGITQCRNCHSSTASVEPFAVLKNAFKPINIAEHNQQCISCHAMGKHSINPHQLSPDNLAQSSLPIPQAHQQGIACASCHKEHQDQLLPNKQAQTDYCQACHEKPLYRFPDNHPEFIDYPIKQIKHIRFDHKDHIDRHFADEPEFAPAQCSSCHSIDKNGTPTVAGFADSCQSCHQKDVFSENLATGPKGFAVLSIPGLDIETLQANNIHIGQWPQWSEEPVNPVWSYLLPDTPEILSNQELLDLTGASPQQLKHIQTLALNLKQYLYKLSQDGSSETAQNWTLQLSQAELKNAINTWFPALESEIPLIDSGTPPPTVAISPQEEAQQTTTSKKNSDEEPFDFDDGDILDDDNEEESLDELFGDNDSLADDNEEDSLDDLFGDKSDAKNNKEANPLPQKAQPNPEQWMKQGGWYLQEFALYYRSTGHSDINLKQWLGKAPELFNEDSSGRCLKCHSIDDQLSSWKAQQRNSAAARLTSFDHAQHLNMVNIDNCQNCHTIPEHSNDLGFEPIKKQQCLDCHNEQTNLNQCSACHNYHLPWDSIDFSNKSRFEASTTTDGERLP